MTTRAPLPESSRIVGQSRSNRVRSVTTPSLAGTFRSARSRISLPRASSWSSVRNRIGSADLLKAAEERGGIQHPAGEAPLIVVPADDVGEPFIDDCGLRRIESA